MDRRYVRRASIDSIIEISFMNDVHTFILDTYYTIW